MRRFARTTPGVLGALAITSAVLCLITGVSAANQLSGKIAQRDAVLARTEPVAFAAQRLYVALSAADAWAATAFLSGGVESPQVRDRYQQALADAAASLAEATAGADDPQTRSIVARITTELPAYAGLVEAARANNRLGHPVGSAYLREASGLMQTSLLPTAEELTTSRISAVRTDQRAIAALPGSTIALLLLTLIACAATSIVLLRRTNRRFNPGVLVAAGLTLITMLWAVAATLVAAQAVDDDAAGARARFETLVQARISAQQARTAETLQMVTRGDLTESEQRFADHTGQLRQRLDSVSDAVTEEEFSAWTRSHVQQTEAYRRADYRTALDRAIGTGPDSTATNFGDLDAALLDALTRVRGELRDGVDAGGDRLALSPTGTLLLMTAAAAAVLVGMWPRLKEFL
ncbi:hypothetical protein HLB23_25525 [Nocardia uniformis]|uniref:Uncharacterized protein n=1 Tax=Nocardia uniformis TaxID=53432 RepID=A0A849C640_9NOCA|nr:hypothetical protein [Nocardia uniformis]